MSEGRRESENRKADKKDRRMKSKRGFKFEIAEQIALPIMAIAAVLSIFYSLALNISAMVAGLVYLALGICIVMLLFQHDWIYAEFLFGFAVLVFLAIMFAEVVSLGLEALTGKLSEFIF